MKYSVITACLNSAATLGRTIESVLLQEVLPEEYIFVDGGSSDGTLEIIDEAIARGKADRPQIHFNLIHQTTRGGIYEAWNLALAQVTSPIVCLLNSDDLYYAETMSQVMQIFESQPDVEIVLGSGMYFGDSQLKDRKICKTRPFLVLPFAMTVIHPACFVRKDVYERLGGFDERYRVAGDYEFVYRCHKAGVKFRKTDSVLVQVQTGGFSARNTDIAAVEMAEIGQRYACIKLFARLAYWLRLGMNRLQGDADLPRGLQVHHPKR